MGPIDTMKSEGHAVESICRVLREQGCQVAARTYRAWRAGRPAARTVSDAQVMNAVRDIAWQVGVAGRRKLAPEGPRRASQDDRRAAPHSMPQASAGAVDRAMKALGLNGVRRGKGIRTTIAAKEGNRAGDLLDRDFTAPAPNRTWVTDFTYCRTWAGFVYVAFIVDVFAQRIVAWHASTSKATDVVMIPLRMALWQRHREGHPVLPGELIQHSDAGSQGGFKWSSQHLVEEVEQWPMGHVSRRFARIGGRSRRRDVRWWRGGRIGSGSGRPSAGGDDRGRGSSGRRVLACRVPLAPPRWRRESCAASDGLGPVPVVCRTRRHRDLARPAARCS